MKWMKEAIYFSHTAKLTPLRLQTDQLQAIWGNMILRWVWCRFIWYDWGKSVEIVKDSHQITCLTCGSSQRGRTGACEGCITSRVSTGSSIDARIRIARTRYIGNYVYQRLILRNDKSRWYSRGRRQGPRKNWPLTRTPIRKGLEQIMLTQV